MLAATLSLKAVAKTNYTLPSLVSTTNDLADRLAADEDFKTFVITHYQFLETVRLKKLQVQLLRIIERQATTEEKDYFIRSAGFNSHEEFNSFHKTLIETRKKFQAKIPEVITCEREIIKSAISKVITKNATLQHTLEDCLLAYLSIMTVCSQGCLYAENYDVCFYECIGAATLANFICFLLAD